ncbi:MAG: hypothetical protein KAR84_06325 [Elusimicrobiales bacterium]|nr:hypothetical protein [Elusimicrobiales bacterium]MCK5358626.1 hypothetical protein [Elusimicrobiales bacterium]MCK5583469.1 hypothetical protein [Elusimicrobiales bacterium]
MEKLGELRIFKEAERISDSVWNSILTWNIFEKDTIGKQLAIRRKLKIDNEIKINLKNLLPQLNAYITSIKSRKDLK